MTKSHVPLRAELDFPFFQDLQLLFILFLDCSRAYPHFFIAVKGVQKYISRLTEKFLMFLQVKMAVIS